MICIKKVSGLFCGLACLLALAFCACDSVPENCGDGSRLNPETQFCFGGQAYDKCGGKEYDPTVNKCEYNVLKTKCDGGDDYYDPAAEFCDGGGAYVKCGGLTYDPASQICVNGVLRGRCGASGYDPESEFCYGGNVHPKCNGQIFDPASQICENNVLKTKCGDNYYNSAAEFCSGGSVYPKCGGQTYDPANQICESSVLKTKCGDNFYNPAAEFCAGGSVYSKCGDEEYDPAAAICENNILKAPCGSEYYNPAFEFCVSSVIYAKCSGETYDPANQSCENGVLKSKCGSSTYNPLTEFCSNGTVQPITYTLSVTANPAGSGFVSREPDANAYNAGTLVSVTAAAAEGYVFTGWAGASTVTAKAIQITMDGDKILTANFQPIPPVITTDGIEMALVDGGTFFMGCTNEQVGDCMSDESPVHRVTVSGFYIGKFEVTQGQWARVMGSYPSDNRGNDNFPVENISWNQVDTFIVELNKMTGRKYRLPTEAEWEFAARGGNKSGGFKYSGSDTLENVAWYYHNGNGKTHIVGTKAPNELGIYDMSGNVYEWVNDWRGTYSSSIQTDPTGPETGTSRVARGGGSCYYTSYCSVKNSRVSYRGGYWNPYNKESYIGFRLVLDP